MLNSPPLDPEAFTLYESGIDLLLQGARQEPGEQRRQTLINEARVHMSRAEHIKLALGPPQSPSPTRPASAGRRDSGKGKAALSRPKPTAADVRGSLRVRGRFSRPNAFGEGWFRRQITERMDTQSASTKIPFFLFGPATESLPSLVEVCVPARTSVCSSRRVSVLLNPAEGVRDSKLGGCEGIAGLRSDGQRGRA